MRSQKLSLTTNPVAFSYKNKTNRIFQAFNLSTADTIYLQFGDAPGTIDDAWPVGAGQQYTLDPAAPVDTVWVWASTANIGCRFIMG